MALEAKHRIKRRSIVGMEGMWTKMWDPPKASPATPDRVTPDNPVPAFMEQRFGSDVFRVSKPNVVQRDLLHGLTVRTWDNAKDLEFMTFRDKDLRVKINGQDGFFPGPTIRVPRGVIFHGEAQGHGPPPHTIHWHGMEPTPMNDGVGHCSMELGTYTYQFQPNFIGTYFYHCHRNTVQHFEFGLYGMLLVEPPDAYDPSIPNVEGETTKNVGGYPRRTAANLAKFSEFPGYKDGDPTWGVAGPLDGFLGDPDPHAFTVPYDVEALWVLDDRDSVWSDLASDAKAFYPGGASTQDGPLALEDADGNPLPGSIDPVRPGVDDQFPHGFFHDFNADYWFVTGVPVPAHRGETGTIGTNLLVPAELNSGVAGMRIDVAATVGQTILIRVLNGAYNTVEVTFPVDVVIIAFDGRALGVPPFARYNEPFELKKNTPFRFSTARRFDVLVRATNPIDSFATAQFFDTRGQKVAGVDQSPLVTARIPFVISES